MSIRNRIPTAIQPLLRLPPEASLTVLTGTLGCSPSWLTSRFIGSLIGSPSANNADERTCSVVLVSWLRDLTFWKSEIRRAMGLDLSKAIENKQLMFIGGVLELAGRNQGGAVSAFENIIVDAIKKLSHAGSESKILLVLDCPDVLLASASGTAQQLNLLVLRMRSLVHSVLLVCSADQPLLLPVVENDGMHATPLETEGSRFLTQQAHNARLVMSVRELATGAARDVSGVLRVTRSCCASDENEGQLDSTIPEMEALYLVQRDGSVKVFQRGADST